MFISCNIYAANVLTESSPEKAGFNVEQLNRLDQWISQQVNKKGYPGVNLLIIKDNQIVYRKAWGSSKKYEGSNLMAQPVPLTTDTMYDLASNTKMYATNFALQKLVSEGKLNPNDLVSKYIPGFSDSPDDVIKGKSTLRISDLLHHSSGFSDNPQYYNKFVAGDLYSLERKKTLEMIKKTPLEYKPGSEHVYSDINFMLLGFIVESVTGQPLDHYVEETIYRPLGLRHTVFNPLLKGFQQKQIAATELNGNTLDGTVYFPGIRTTTIWGTVHDEKAFYSMGGVAGHAGLFSNTSDIAVLMQTMLNGGSYGDVTLFSPETVKMFTTSSKEDPTFGLGWRVNGDVTMATTFGTLASAQTYGHTGWTGTLTVIDPVNKMAIVMLSNRPHTPVDDPQRLRNNKMYKGGLLPISTYGWVVDQVYAALKQK